jgi:hypothetical protein
MINILSAILLQNKEVAQTKFITKVVTILIRKQYTIAFFGKIAKIDGFCFFARL